jgi:hypothetical protein
MKTRSFVLSLVVLLAAFAVNTAVMAQSHDLKNSNNKGKITVNQTATTTTHHTTNQTKGGVNTVNSDVKTNPEKDMKKTESEIKHNETMSHKPEKNPIKK